ncbi:EamA family transporter [Pseudoxanthomonas sacheonensis]|uniref:EamA family transporter n=1 Tax=Pseudoxanthomonas sacheonensis TaxID=443615 RepID=UPI0013D3C615|nr:EamA family transporter [Pseudoxanthomonas sacheonensis]KAF1708599.1 hypothetical protein CSC73_07835 [Pseudoxanthomonas sacheonensis]
MSKSNWFFWAMVGATIAFTTYGQIVLKWQVAIRSGGTTDFVRSIPELLLRPWVISAFVAAFAASLCWMVAITRLELSRAYPFMALNFILVSLLAIPLFGESFGLMKVAGVLLVVAGLVAISHG